MDHSEWPRVRDSFVDPTTKSACVYCEGWELSFKTRVMKLHGIRHTSIPHYEESLEMLKKSLLLALLLIPALTFAVEVDKLAEAIDTEKAADSVDAEKLKEAVDGTDVDMKKAYDAVDKEKAADSVDTDKLKEALSSDAEKKLTDG
jgi:hypothetical protein